MSWLGELGDFLQTQILGMKWLHGLLGSLLEWLGVELTGKWGGALHFFLYDVIKIVLLLLVMIYVISYIQSYFPPARTRKLLGRFQGLGANTVAALLGTVTPFCSCSSIPIFIGFTKAGLPLGVTFSFLISSPMVDLASLILLMSIFGWRIAVAYVLLGLVIAVAGGAFIARCGLEEDVEPSISQQEATDVIPAQMTREERFTYAWERSTYTAYKVFPYILCGVGVGALIHNWLPEELVATVLGSGSGLGVIAATLLGVPVYADIFGCLPIAEALLAKGAGLGVVLSFMMAVTTLSLPSLIMLKRVVRPRLLGLFMLICIVGIIAVGYVFNFMQGWLI